jgi:hypothetical protein
VLRPFTFKIPPAKKGADTVGIPIVTGLLMVIGVFLIFPGSTFLSIDDFDECMLF